jgi:hypothetical protein
MIFCAFCDQPAIDGGYIQPPMCQRHLSVAILISLLKSRGQIASLENVRLLAAYTPKAGIKPEEVEGLLEPMRQKEEVHV